ncbi:FAD-dependent oxidoreductase [Chloroflexi bacterium TSY]|nr:FAD-dependent oxidoreductase [Chloroflexi bacterium TSY]
MSEYDIAIIGGGPAGLAAATYALNAHLNVALIAPRLGGKVSYQFHIRDQEPMDTVWGAGLVRQFEEFVRDQSLHSYENEVKRMIKTKNGEYRLEFAISDDSETASIQARAIIVATGAEPQQLYIPGEEELWGHGVSYSAHSHAPLFRGRDVAIVGYGSRMIIAALKLASIAKHVYLFPTSVLPESDKRIQQMKDDPKVSFMTGWHIQRIDGNDAVTQIVIAAGYSVRVLEVDGVFIELGLLPTNEFLRDLVPLDPETGHICVNQRCETSVPGVFAAGDVTDVYAEQVPVAMGEGVKAAISAWEYLIVGRSRGND